MQGGSQGAEAVLGSLRIGSGSERQSQLPNFQDMCLEVNARQHGGENGCNPVCSPVYDRLNPKP